MSNKLPVGLTQSAPKRTHDLTRRMPHPVGIRGQHRQAAHLGTLAGRVIDEFNEKHARTNLVGNRVQVPAAATRTKHQAAHHRNAGRIIERWRGKVRLIPRPLTRRAIKNRVSRQPPSGAVLIDDPELCRMNPTNRIPARLCNSLLLSGHGAPLPVVGTITSTKPNAAPHISWQKEERRRSKMNSNERANGGTAQAAPVGLTTGSPTVDKIGQMYFEGNIIDRRWMAAPKLRLPSGRLNLPALIVLADIIYWHRPTMVVDEHTNQITEVRKKFSEKEMYKSYEEWADSLGLTVRQLREAVAFLVKQKIIARRVGTFKLKSGVRSNNVAFITPNPEAISSLTYGTAETPESETPTATMADPSRSNGRRHALQRDISVQRAHRDSTTKTTSRARAKKLDDDEVETSSLVARLVAAGASPARAKRAASANPEEMEHRLKYLEHFTPENPGAWLTANPETAYTPPPAFRDAEAAHERQRASKAATERATASRRAERTSAANAQQEAAQLDAQLAQMPKRERDKIERQAQAERARFAAVGGLVAPPVDVLKRNILREHLTQEKK